MEEDPFTPGYGEFQGIPKRTLPDDTVEYSIYIPGSSKSAPRLEAVKDAAETLVKEWGQGYIWQRESFDLAIAESDGNCLCLPSLELVLILRRVRNNVPDGENGIRRGHRR
jgi:hypothetical protein